MRAILTTESDDQGNIWIDLTPPIEVRTEQTEPHRIAIKARARNAQDAPDPPIWLRITRTEGYRLLDNLTAALADGDRNGAKTIIKKSKFVSPVNGGVNSETGDMILLLRGASGLEQQIEIPFDQSGPMLEILDRAASAAGKWHDERSSVTADGFRTVDIQPREAESLLLGEDPASGRPVLVARIVGGHQFSFFLDQRIVEQLRNRPRKKDEQNAHPTHRWTTVADDIEWFQKEWCVLYEPPSDADLRRGSAALRRLLVDNTLQEAWRHYGFSDQPTVTGPDLKALLTELKRPIQDVVSLIAGGATLNGIQLAMIGAAQVANDKTGVPADAEEGFAVEVFSVSRDARHGPADSSALVDLTEKSWRLNAYLDAPGAVRRGTAFKRRDVIKFFANYAGGVHLKGSKKTAGRKEEVYEHIAELEQKIQADTMDGLYFELLSIGQALGKSADLRALTAKIRSTN
ncbi:hypothetical protein [Mesorhizobium sp. L2C084A000]|uniref:hypothetical protein n=1 Tax=Mesorhizobium sp. L2C084A000 TaxID=1287116 RepID=UPI0003D0137E|nr:hypothetical protein [Mesorhizobium sp. L2C084A000]ESZ20032.1 hypothetical protein X734_31765 [Mesorhizobium sp. L2C084A000]